MKQLLKVVQTIEIHTKVYIILNRRQTRVPQIHIRYLRLRLLMEDVLDVELSN